MNAPFFELCNADPAVQALLGSPVAIHPWGENLVENRRYPYVTFQSVAGSPENYLSGRPDTDSFTLQIDIWCKVPAQARAIAAAIRDAIELRCYITAWRGESVEPATKVYRISFDCDWIVQRKN